MIKVSLDAKSLSKAVQLIEKTAKKAEKALATSSVHAAAIVAKNAKEIIGVQRGIISTPSGSTWDKPSAPGQPPKRRTGKLQKSIRFESDGGKGAVVISKYPGSGKRKENGFLWRLLETGTSWKVFNRKKGTYTPVVMKPRPFRQRALDKSMSRIPILLKTEITKALS